MRLMNTTDLGTVKNETENVIIEKSYSYSISTAVQNRLKKSTSTSRLFLNQKPFFWWLLILYLIQWWKCTNSLGFIQVGFAMDLFKRQEFWQEFLQNKSQVSGGHRRRKRTTPSSWHVGASVGWWAGKGRTGMLNNEYDNYASWIDRHELTPVSLGMNVRIADAWQDSKLVRIFFGQEITDLSQLSGGGNEWFVNLPAFNCLLALSITFNYALFNFYYWLVIFQVHPSKCKNSHWLMVYMEWAGTLTLVNRRPSNHCYRFLLALLSYSPITLVQTEKWQFTHLPSKVCHSILLQWNWSVSRVWFDRKFQIHPWNWSLLADDVVTCDTRWLWFHNSLQRGNCSSYR